MLLNRQESSVRALDLLRVHLFKKLYFIIGNQAQKHSVTFDQEESRCLFKKINVVEFKTIQLLHLTWVPNTPLIRKDMLTHRMDIWCYS